LSRDDQSSGSCSSSISDASCSASASSSICLPPSEGGASNGGSYGVTDCSSDSGSGNGESNQNAHNQMCEAIDNTILIGSSVGTVCGIAAVTIPAAQAPGAACSAMGGVVALVGSVASKIGGC
jgi:hypothetical protein